ncbi:glutathione S-transferase N-terminal domain-containing protein [Sphingomonas sp. ERG5]|uniref:glutathione S-transferase N-terminal domain-containing protein n=1 Tax=Sphingomonas sp. ERG5 TaxID=1381597 RepID=UPI00054BB0A4|nr:glutathione S-transferase N-terminal domain-containing protein [Sphingomonas sp. ERG5]
MKLFFAPGFSSLADHIALLEAGLPFEIAEVDPESKRLVDGSSYLDINPNGLVPALMFDDGRVLTENVAILAWVADRAPQLAPPGDFGRYRLLETLSFIASEIHKRFPIYLSLPEDTQGPIAGDIVRWFDCVAPRLTRGYLFGETFSVADAYLFVMARGALYLEFPLDERLRDYVARIEARPAVQAALTREATLSGSRLEDGVEK